MEPRQIRKMIDLAAMGREILDRMEARRVPGVGSGAYAAAPGGQRVDLYACVDVLHMLVVMGRDPSVALNPEEKVEWGGHIRSFQRPDGGFDGVFTTHSQYHALGMVIGALGPLGQPLEYRHGLFDELREVENVSAWLERIDWARQWQASHLFWGGMHCFSTSGQCSPEWKEAVVAWLDRELDPETGWWRRGVPHADRHQAPGGSAHIVPIYQHAGRRFPCPEALLDSVLALQLPQGNWLAQEGAYPVSYLDLDALYLLRFAAEQRPEHRPAEVRAAAERFGKYVIDLWQGDRERLFSEHPHHVLGLVGSLGLLQQHLPDSFADERSWSDIFSDRRLYQTDVACPLG